MKSLSSIIKAFNKQKDELDKFISVQLDEDARLADTIEHLQDQRTLINDDIEHAARIRDRIADLLS